jgi:TonB-dependent receptor
MFDLPLSSTLTLNAGLRFESTSIGVVNIPEADATWFPPGSDTPVHLNPGDADVSIGQDDILPSIGLSWQPDKEFTLRAAFSQTVARQTFKELTPIMQQEFLGGPVFIGNPELAMSALRNYDLRLDYVPHEGALWSASWFLKDITNPIEYVQRLAGFTYTTPINYPKGALSGYELEVREGLERLWSPLRGLSAGANATFIQSEVTLPASEAEGFSDPGIQAPMSSRDMTNAPDHLYNFFLTYDFPDAETQVALFYTVQGDMLVAGAGESLGNFIPSLYAKEYDTLNLSLTHSFGKRLKLGLQAKNLTNPSIEEVYRSPYIGADVTKTSYTKGIEFSLGLSLTF